MDTQEYHRLRQKLESEHRANLEALERVYALSKAFGEPQQESLASSDDNKTQQSPVADVLAGTGSGSAGSAIPLPKGHLLRAAEEVIGHLPSGFTWMDVQKELSSRDPLTEFKDPSVRQAVNRLVELNRVGIVTKGAGRSPTRYEVKEPT